jgi:hypothetical protein
MHSHKLNAELEALALGKVVLALMDADYRVEVSDKDSGDGVVWVYAFEGDLRPEKFSHYVKFMPGNTADCIVDYTTNLEEVLEPINTWLAAYQD